MLWSSILLILLILWLTNKWKMRRIVELSKKIKCGLKSYPLIGHAYLFMGNGEDRMKGLIKLGRQALLNGGLLSGWLGQNFYLIVADPVDLKVITKSALSKGDEMRILRTFTGNGSIFAPVRIWRPRRKVLMPIFSLKNLTKFVQVFSCQSAITVKKMSKHAGNEAVSPWNYITSYTLDAICETTMNLQLNSQKMTNLLFSQSFSKVTNVLASRVLKPWLHFDPTYKLLPSYREFVEQSNVVQSFVSEAIKSCRRQIEENKEKSKQGFKTMVELMLESSRVNGKSFSDLELQEEALVFVSAGNDTSATAVCFVLSLLARHPDVQDKIFEELQEVFGDSDRPMIADDLPHLKYLEVVIKESLRLYPPVPIITRKIDKDLELPSGITLVKGCTVVGHIWAVNRNPEYWGEDAEQFRPERFIDAPPKDPAAFMSFSHGPRNCIGGQYTMMSMKTILSKILKSYRVSCEDFLHNNQKPMRLSYEIMMRDADGFKVRLEKRKPNKSL